MDYFTGSMGRVAPLLDFLGNRRAFVLYDFDIPGILLLVLNFMIGLAYFVLAIVYFFVEARVKTQDTHKRTVILSGIIFTTGLAVVIMTRYFILFPKIAAIDMNSDMNLIIGIVQVIFGFFIYILYLRCGEHFSRYYFLPGSLYLKGERMSNTIDWKLILIPLPFLMAWTFIWFAFLNPEPTELVQALTPESEGPLTYLYLMLSISVLAPIKEEIVYRHFTMGLFYRWFGRRPVAVIINILLTSIFFSIAHLAILTDDWVKFLQILPAGLVFGYIYHRKGLEHSILAHALFNTLVIPVSYLVEYFTI